ncbi:putative type I fatty acid synthase, partial [Cardiosporidium cionae]
MEEPKNESEVATKLWKNYDGNPFSEVLRKYSLTISDEVALNWLNAQGQISSSLTYKELFDRIIQIAAFLRIKLGLNRGDRAILCFPPGTDFPVAFFACIYNGIIAIPVYPPDPAKGSADVTRFCDIANVGKCKVVLSNSSYSRVIHMLSPFTKNPIWNKLNWICIDKVEKETFGVDVSKIAPVQLDSTDVAFLQFTSGSTANPKGVMVTHMSLLHNCHLCWLSFQFPSILEAPIDESDQEKMNHCCISDYPIERYMEFWQYRQESSIKYRGHRMRTFSWLPVYHDMGLIGFICSPLLCGATLFQMSPLDFIKKPHLWLQCMSDYDCICCAAPNFAFDIVVRKMPDSVYEKLDLSRICGILSGANPVKPATVQKFIEKFSPKGLRPAAIHPAFGLAEHTLIVTGNHNWRETYALLTVNSYSLQRHNLVEIITSEQKKHLNEVDYKEFVGCGQPFNEVEIRIVDPSTLHEMPPDHSGEILIYSSSKAAGYYDSPEETQNTFYCSYTKLDGSKSPAQYLRTGDIGFIYNKQLFISGRMKDVIIIRGRNYFPDDIEDAVAKVPQLRIGCAAAFSLEGGSEELVGIAAEIRMDEGFRRFWNQIRRKQNKIDYEDIVHNVCSSVMLSTGLRVHRVWLIRPHSVPKTSSGKIRRAAAREAVLAGTMEGLLYDSIVYAEADPVSSNSNAQRHETLPSDSAGNFSGVGTLAAPLRNENAISETAPISMTDLALITENVRTAVIKSATEILGGNSISKFDAPLYELGIDSISAVEFAETLSNELQMDLEPTLLFNYPTVSDMIDFLVKEMQGKMLGDTILSSPKSGEAIAICGVACNFPGGSTSLESFWDLLIYGVDAITEVPRSRWDADEFYDPDPDAEGKMYIRESGFIENAEMFDAAFFRIPPSEAKAMDPQQRLLLEVAYECLHNSGYNKEKLRRAPFGVFVGCCANDWSQVCSQMNAGINSYSATSHSASIISNRVSYSLALTGPSLTIDTACSSSLVAIHVAAHELRSGSCTGALACGVNLMLSPMVTVAFCKARMMAPDARCKTFDASANGYIRGEGIGAIFLKPLSSAENDKDNIHCVIRGTAINHGGKAASLTAPSSPSQQRVIEAAIRNAQIKPADVQFIESHGTGTPLGDPIEVGALRSVFARDRDMDSPLTVGAVKTNLGHLEGAAGIISIIKAILVLKYQEIPRNLHFEQLNPHIKTKDFPLLIPKTNLPFLVSPNTKRIAGVSSFGFGGTNAHAILEEAPILENFEKSLIAQKESKPPTTVFLFGGSGNHYFNMGKYLYDNHSVFRDVIMKCNEIFLEMLSVQLVEVLYPINEKERNAAWLQQLKYSQPALFAFQFALAEYWKSIGVKPDVVMGVGVGEIVAAACAGVFTMEDALRAVIHRSSLIDSLPSDEGVMVACRASEEEVEFAMAEIGSDKCNHVAVAVVYGPKSVVLSGNKNEIESILLKLNLVGKCKYLEVSHAFSSPLLIDAVNPFSRAISRYPRSQPQIRLINGRTGEFACEDVLDKHYWSRHIVETTRFQQGIHTVISAGCKIFIELGPKPTLINMALQNANRNDLTWIASMDEVKPMQQMLKLGLATFQKASAKVNEQRRAEQNACEDGSLLYHRQPFSWIEIPHPFVGKEKSVMENGDIVFESSFPRRAIPLFMDHAVNGIAIMPGTGLIEMMVVVGIGIGMKDPSCAVSMENVVFERPMMICTQRAVYDFSTRSSVDSSGNRTPHTVRTPRRVNDAFSMCSSRTPRRNEESAVANRVAAKVSQMRGTTPINYTSFSSSNRGAFNMFRSTTDDPHLVSTEHALINTNVSANAEKISVSEYDAGISAAPNSGMSIVCRVNSSRFVSISSFRDSEGDDPIDHCSGKIVIKENDEISFPPFSELFSLCTTSVDIGELYDMLYDVGLHYGPRFRTIQSIFKGEGEALAQLQMIGAGNFDAFESGFFFHPAILDGALQVGAVLLRDNNPAAKAMVPVSIQRMFIRKFNPHSACWTHVKLIKFESKSAIMDIVIYNEDHEVIAFLSQVLVRSIDISASDGVSIPKELMWHVEWENINISSVPNLSDHSILYFGGDSEILKLIQISQESKNYQFVSSICPNSPNSEIEKVLLSTKWSAIVFLDALVQSEPEYATVVLNSALRLIQSYSKCVTTMNGAFPSLWFVTSGCMLANNNINETSQMPVHAGLWSFARTARNELEASLGVNVYIGCIDVANRDCISTLASTVLKCSVIEKNESFESELSLSLDILQVARLKKCPMKIRGCEELFLPERGALTNLRPRPQAFATRNQPESNSIEIRVRAVGLNFRDVLNVMGLYPGDPGPPGGDCAGTVVSVGSDVNDLKVGDAVFGIAPGCLKTYVTTDSRLMRKLPAGMSFEEASALPVVGATVELALCDLAKVKGGDRVLIHAVTGGVGIAAVQLCQRVGATVYGTCGSEKKMEFARSMGIHYVTSSRDVEQFTLDMHEFLGDDNKIDVVLNCLIDEFIPASLNVLGLNGRFMELGKRSIWSTERMQSERPDVYYETIAVDVMMEQDPAWFGDMLDRLRRHVDNEQLRSLPLKIFDLTDPVEGGVAAFRFLQRAQHIGKVVVRIPSFLDTPIGAAAEESTFIITGGVGGLGLVFAKWLAEEGVRNIVLLSRRSTPSLTVQRSENWQWLKGQSSALNVEYISCDVSQYDQVIAMFGKIRELHFPPVRGILHAAGVTSDATLGNQSRKSIEAVYNPKAIGAWNLHRACEELDLNKDLKIFMMFSSVSALLGNYGQANYAAANACLDALVQWRRSKGLCGQSIQWGPWLEQGMASDLKQHLGKVGMRGISNELGLRVMHDVMMNADAAVVACQSFIWKSFLQRYERIPSFFKFSKVSTAVVSDSTLLLKSISRTDRYSVVSSTVLELTSAALGTSSAPLMNAPLQELGIDSIGAVDLRNAISSRLGVKLPATAMFDYPTLNALIEFINNTLAEQYSEVGNAESLADSVYIPYRRTDSGVAVLGAACRLPGSSSSATSFFEMMQSGVDCGGEIPLTRWNMFAFYSQDANETDCCYVRQANFIDNVEMFDNSAFSISPVETKIMDPQQRLMLEVTYEAIVNSGFTKEGVNGQEFGVFLGSSCCDWQMIEVPCGPFSGTGSAAAILPNRVSYIFGFRGPSLMVDTACSSSLVALDAAVDKIQSNSCSGAIVGGVNLLLSPHYFVAFCKARMLSPDCRCRSFDIRANGYARGEGVVAFMLKSLEDARRERKHILAIVRGTAVNHDGRSASLTAPNGPSQQEVCRTALRKGGIRPGDISIVESHGTGTSLGDPIEMGALKAVYGQSHSHAEAPLFIGALKTNIGHLEGAAGAAGFLKLILCLQYREIPPNLHFETLNPHIDITNFSAVFPKVVTPLPTSSKLIGALSSFGFGGTNAHVVLEESPEQVNVEPLKNSTKVQWNHLPYPWTPAFHPTLGRIMKSNKADTTIFEADIRVDLGKILAQHVITNQAIVPGALFLETMCAAFSSKPEIYVRSRGLIVTDHSKVVALENIEFLRPLVLQPHNSNYLQKFQIIKAKIDSDNLITISGYDTEDDRETVHATSKLCHDAVLELNEENLESPELISTEKYTPINVNDFYRKLRQRGLNLGPVFKSITELLVCEKKAKARVSLPGGITSCSAGFRIHPCILDACFQSVAALVSKNDENTQKDHTERLSSEFSLMVPFTIEKAIMRSLNGRINELRINATLISRQENQAIANIQMRTKDGECVATLTGVAMRTIDLTPVAAIPREMTWCAEWECMNYVPIPSYLSGQILMVPLTGHANEIESMEAEMQPRIRETGVLKKIAKSEFLSDEELIQTDRWQTILFCLLNEDENEVTALENILVITQRLLIRLQGNMPYLWVITRGTQNVSSNSLSNPRHAGIWSFVRTARLEMEMQFGKQIKFGCADIDPKCNLSDALTLLISQQTENPYEAEVAIKLDTMGSQAEPVMNRYVPRLMKLQMTTRGCCELHMADRGTLSNLSIRPQAMISRVIPLQENVEIRVRAVGLNFRDVLNVTGLYPGDPGPPGGDCAGTVVSVGSDVNDLKVGDAVFGIAP